MEAGITSLCVLAFLGAGYSPTSLDRYDGIVFGNTVWSGLHRLMELQGASGWIGEGPDSDRGALNHALASLALVEAFGLTRDKIYEKCASKGVGALGMGQNRDGGWGDVPGRSDGFSTGVALIVLRVARSFGLDTDRTVEARGLAYFEGLKDHASGRVGYVIPGVDGASLEGINEDRLPYPSLSAFPGIISGNRLSGEEGLRALEKYPEAPLRWIEKPQEADYLFLFLSTWARFRVDGPSGPIWKRWSKDLREVLVKAQALKSEANVCEAGSWSPTDKWSSVGGRVYITAINALTLEIYYRFDNALGAR